LIDLLVYLLRHRHRWEACLNSHGCDLHQMAP
jgi:hypothetical protein